MNVLSVIQLIYNGQDVLLCIARRSHCGGDCGYFRRGVRQFIDEGIHSKFIAGSSLVSNIGLRVVSVSEDDNGETGRLGRKEWIWMRRKEVGKIEILFLSLLSFCWLSPWRSASQRRLQPFHRWSGPWLTSQTANTNKVRKPPKFPWDEIIVIISTMINRFTWIYFYGIMISFSDFMEYFQEQKFCWGILKLCIQWKAFKFGAKEWYFPPNLDLFPTQFESQDNSQERGFSWGWFEFWCKSGWTIDTDNRDWWIELERTKQESSFKTCF